LLRAFGFAELVHVMTDREQAVLLAVLPQLHRIVCHGPALAEAFQRWLGVPVRYVSHFPRHHVIPEGDCSRLSEAYSKLGTSFVLGDRFTEHRSTIELEIDLRAESARERVMHGGWAMVEAGQVAASTKLKLLAEHLISASIHVEWRWLVPLVEPPEFWRLAVFSQSRLGYSTRLDS
jgi:hypothetical protein